MSSLLSEPTNHYSTTESPADRLRHEMAAMRLSFTWFGTRKTLNPSQKAAAAETFGAEGSFLSAGKKLVDAKHPAFRSVTTARNQAVSYWKGVSLPFPEPGLRLIRHDQLSEIHQHMETFRDNLDDAVDQLDRHFESLKSAARQRLGSLYSEADYPDSLRGLFAMTWDFPSVEPPSYLRQLSPEVYREECARIRERFGEAGRLAEAAFTEELAKLVSHLTERLSGTEDGKPKIFRDSVIENLTGFFERFRSLNVGGNEELERLVADAQNIVRGVRPGHLRDSAGLRQHVATEMSRVQSVLDGLLVDRPRRNILRRPK